MRSPLQNDLDLYERHAAHWWDPAHPAFRSLHSMRPFRVALLDEWLAPELSGARVVDLGCGGGLLCAPLSERGARVVGLDLSHASLRSAREHARGAFVRADLRRTPLSDGCADVVLLADVVEHVDTPVDVLREVARLLRAGGACYVSTINRTAKARWLAVHLAEGLAFVPRGTHAAELFVRPEELESAARAAGLELERLQGERARVWSTLLRRAIVLERSDDVSVSYSALLRKRSAPQGVREPASSAGEKPR